VELVVVVEVDVVLVTPVVDVVLPLALGSFNVFPDVSVTLVALVPVEVPADEPRLLYLGSFSLTLVFLLLVYPAILL